MTTIDGVTYEMATPIAAVEQAAKSKPDQMKAFIASIKRNINDMDDLFFSMNMEEIQEAIHAFMAFQKWKEMKQTEFEMRTIEKKAEFIKNQPDDGDVPPEARRIGFVH